MKGKAIYTPSGKAGEYSYWAVNFYNGCSADCSYCYCKRGVLSSVWSTTPTLKKSLEDPTKALSIFMREVDKNLSELKKHGLFFNFTSDPFLRETIDLNINAMKYCDLMDIPVKALTKQTWWINSYRLPKNVTIGFTLTGMDEMEKGAATTIERIAALKYLHVIGYRTWASIEPVVDIHRAISVIQATLGIVDHYKIGTLSGKKYDREELSAFVDSMSPGITGYATVYWKKELLKQSGHSRGFLNDFWSGCVNRDYRFWEG